MIAPQLLGVINEMAGRLGYLAVDGDWGTTEPPADLRVPITVPAPDADAAVGDQGGEPAAAAVLPSAPGADEQPGAGPVPDETAPHEPPARQRPAPEVVDGQLRSERLGAALRAGLVAATAQDAAALAGSPDGEWFVAVAITKGAERPAEYWLVDLGEATVTAVTKQAQEDSDWDMIGSLETWEQVIDRRVNFNVALRACQLRYCDNGETTPLAADTRIAIVGKLLGLGSWE